MGMAPRCPGHIHIIGRSHGALANSDFHQNIIFLGEVPLDDVNPPRADSAQASGFDRSGVRSQARTHHPI